MRSKRVGVVAMSLTLLASVTAGAAEPAAAKLGTIRIQAIGPDGSPLADTRLQLEPTRESRVIGQPVPPRRAAVTDENGMAEFPWPIGNAQILVSAGDEAYGMTGVVEVPPDVTTDAPLPRLAPFARVSGNVPAGIGRDKALRVGFRALYGEETASAEVDATGRFSAALPGGSYGAAVYSGQSQIAGFSFQVAPGEIVDGVVPKAFAPEDVVASTQPYAIGRELPQEQTIVWAEGAVRNEKGAPIPQVDVYADAVYHGGMRMYERGAKARTDARGHYRITGEGGLSMFSATLVAYKPGMTPAYAWISLPDVPFAEVPPGQERPTTRMATPPPLRRDFVLSARGGSLRVTVEAKGKPAAGAWVQLQREGGSLRDTWAASEGGPELEAVGKIAYPRGQTDAGGVISFDHLSPGRYSIDSVLGSELDLGMASRGFAMSMGEPPVADARGVPVNAGGLTEFHIGLRPSVLRAKLRILNTNGTPRTGKIGLESRYPPPRLAYGSGQIDLDKNGVGTVGDVTPGIWRFRSPWKRTPYPWADPPEPYLDAQAAVGLSSLLEKMEPITMTTMLVEPGSVVVQLLGVDGKPARGIVSLGQEVGTPTMVASTDDSGRARFDAIPSRTYLAKAYLAGQKSIGSVATADGPLPDDHILAGRTFFLPESVTAEANRVRTLTLRARPAAFIRGRVALSGKPTPEYDIYADVPNSQGYVRVTRRPDGEFLAGPFAGGKIELSARIYNDEGAFRELELQTVEGQVLHADIRVDPPATESSRRSNALMVGAGGAQDQGTGEEQLRGQVLLADGKMPADGAMLLYFPKDQWQPTLAATADIQGTLHPRGLWYSNNARPPQPPGSPEHDAIVAILPGVCGAKILDVSGLPNQPLRIVLPRPVSVRGRVTVAGAPAVPAGKLLVLAQYQGRGKLDGILSLWVTPQSDGSFDLTGLTPGVYRVQASLDGIWLSNTLTLDVDQSDLPPINLQIGAPAGPSCVELVDTHGQPVRGWAVTIDRPDGPLTTFHWPEKFITDGAGRAWIPPLERGTHVFHVPDASLTGKIIAPDLESGKPAIVRVEIKGKS